MASIEGPTREPNPNSSSMARLFLNAILGPLVGGIVTIIILMRMSGEGIGGWGGIGGMLMLSYAIGIVPALMNGVFAAAVARFLGRAPRLALAPVTGAVATASFGVIAFGGMINNRAFAVVSLVGAFASLVCAVAAEGFVPDPATPDEDMSEKQ